MARTAGITPWSRARWTLDGIARYPYNALKRRLLHVVGCHRLGIDPDSVDDGVTETVPIDQPLQWEFLGALVASAYCDSIAPGQGRALAELAAAERDYQALEGYARALGRGCGPVVGVDPRACRDLARAKASYSDGGRR